MYYPRSKLGIEAVHLQPLQLIALHANLEGSSSGINILASDWSIQASAALSLIST